MPAGLPSARTERLHQRFADMRHGTLTLDGANSANASALVREHVKTGAHVCGSMVSGVC